MGRSDTQLTVHRGVGGTGSPIRNIVLLNRPTLRQPPPWLYQPLLRRFGPLDARSILDGLLPGALAACARLVSAADMPSGAVIHGLGAVVLAMSVALLPTVSLPIPRWHSRHSVASACPDAPRETPLPDRGPISIVRDWAQTTAATMLYVSPCLPAAMTIATLGPGGLHSIASAAMQFIATRHWPRQRPPAAPIRIRGE